MKFCPNCGSEIVSKMNKSSWSIIHVCLNLRCSAGVYQTILGDPMGGSGDSTNSLSVSSQQREHLLRDARDPNIKRLQLDFK